MVVDVALGRQPEVRRTQNRCVGVRFAYPRRNCIVEAVSVPDNGVLQAAALVEPGAAMRLPPAEFISRHAYVICAGHDPYDCAAELDKALSEVRLTATRCCRRWPRPLPEEPIPVLVAVLMIGGALWRIVKSSCSR